jgi:hypothetical protein
MTVNEMVERLREPPPVENSFNDGQYVTLFAPNYNKLLQNQRKAADMLVELQELLRDVTTNWALHGISPELQARIDAALESRK